MRVSVIIPVYQVLDFLDEALQSVATQDYADKEILLVDDGSAPDQAAIITALCHKHPSVTLLRQVHGGAAAARNNGVAHSRAELIVFLDADDVLQPGALRFFVDAMQAHSKAIATYGRVQMIDAEGQPQGSVMPSDARVVSGRQVLPFLLERKLPFCNGSICIRRQALNGLSVHNTHLTVGEDWVLWCHLALAGTIVSGGNRVVLHRRKHPGNISAQGIENPSLILAAYECIYTEPAFIHPVGEAAWHTLKEKCLCRIHAYLASTYAARGETEKAARHFGQITLPLSAFDDSGETG